MTNKNEALPNTPNSERATTENQDKFNTIDNLFEQTVKPIPEQNSEINTNEVSLFKNFYTYIGNFPLTEMIHDIQNGKYKTEIEKIRVLRREGIHSEADTLKRKLPGFTTSGIFNNGRKADQLTEYSGFIVLDIDKLTPEELVKAKETAVGIPYTYSAFISPSGNGLKIIIKSNHDRNSHASVIIQASNYYFERINLPIDPSGKDVSRLCFVSYDPDCYFNPKAEKFSIAKSLEFIKKQSNQKHHTTTKVESTDKQFQDCVEFTERKMSYFEGNRNNFIHLLACNCNRKGIPETTALSLIQQNYDLNQDEIEKSVQSAYKNNTQEHANFANLANFAPLSSNRFSTKNNRMYNLPHLPDDIFQQLPEILKDGCKVFSDKRERDVFLTGAIGILSGCMHNVKGVYNGKIVYANLFVFIIAPPATGKGALQFSKMLGMHYHSKLLKTSKEQRKIYNIQIDEYKKSLHKNNDTNERMEMPEKPPFKILYIPANNSSARVIQHLVECDEQGIFCETEADTMGNALKKDWGSYSDLLRKAFHHEAYTYSRKVNDEFIELNNPKLSVALAGTPGQVEGLIKSAEDGLFSRFLFYSFRSEPEWRDAGEEMNGYNLTEHFEVLSIKVTNFVEFMTSTKAIKFKLTDNQWMKLNQFGEACITDLTTLVSEDMASTAKRFGLILYRVAMIITALRYFDNGEVPINMNCSDDDFEIALKLVNIYQEHSAFMYRELPKSNAVSDRTLMNFLDSLPDEFQRKDAVDIALKINIKERTADGYLAKLVSNGLLEQPKLGIYQKK